ncbi:MAG: hypothetical protein JJE30_07430 [Desulfuromonadales bacterium]|nr:hypothetical protein [Desulfuromonadales bacterium]
MKFRSLFGLILSFALLAMFGCSGGDGNGNGNGSVAVAPQFTITASAGAGGSISPSGAVLVTQGSSQTFTIAPDVGSAVSNVLVDGVSQGAITTYTFTNVTANHTIAAVFTAGQPTTATVTLATTGTLLPGSSIGTIVAVMNYPLNKILNVAGVPVQQDGVTPVTVTPTDPTGTFPLIIPGTTFNPDFTQSGVVALNPLFLPTGIGTGAFATIEFTITPGTFPTAADFTTATGFHALDLNGIPILGDSSFVLGPVIIQ